VDDKWMLQFNMRAYQYVVISSWI